MNPWEKSSFKEKIFLVIGRPNHIKWNRYFNGFLMILVSLNVLAVMLETVESLDQKYHNLFFVFEVVSVSFFSLEYLVRLWTCKIDPRYAKSNGRLRYGFTLMALVDLAAILPSLIPILGADLRALRVLRLFRLVRLFKLVRYSYAIRSLVSVVKRKRPELAVAGVSAFFLLIISSCLMYFIEHSVQPEKFSSIPATMWWAMSTLTTVGYGDIYPITPLGQFLGAITAFLGLALFALPAGIIAKGFAEEMDEKFERGKNCPLCGEQKKGPKKPSENLKLVA